MQVEIGSLDRRIRIEQKVITQNSSTGAKTAAWTTLCTDWANIQEVLPSKSGESTASGIRIAERPARIRMRYRADITAAMRLVDLDRSDRVMKILSPPIEIGGRKRFIEFMASDFSSQGDAT